MRANLVNSMNVNCPTTAIVQKFYPPVNKFFSKLCVHFWQYAQFCKGVSLHIAVFIGFSWKAGTCVESFMEFLAIAFHTMHLIKTHIGKADRAPIRRMAAMGTGCCQIQHQPAKPRAFFKKSGPRLHRYHAKRKARIFSICRHEKGRLNLATGLPGSSLSYSKLLIFMQRLWHYALGMSIKSQTFVGCYKECLRSAVRNRCFSV